MDKLTVLYEDNHVIVVLKPQNIPSQADKSGDEDMLTMVKKYVKQKYNKPGDVYIGLVHRLDRPTGGVMVFARTSKAAERLSNQIKEGTLEKKYMCVTVGTPVNKQARLVNHLVKDTKTNVVKVVPAPVEGSKRAELDYKVLDSLDKISIIDVKLITGRSHQIRVQMANLGTPIFGDTKYGGDVLSKGHNLALWAYELRFYHPVSKKPMVFKVFPPTENTPWKYFNVEKFMNVIRP